jgi:hypothetical protein
MQAFSWIGMVYSSVYEYVHTNIIAYTFQIFLDEIIKCFIDTS